MSTNPVLFISYSHKDESHKDFVVSHLKVAERQDVFDVWDDRRIKGGGDWQAEIDAALDQADIAVLLISRHFLTSDFIMDHEVRTMLQRHADHDVIIYPILISDCTWQNVDWLKAINVRPTDAVPLNSFDEAKRDQVMADIASEIAKMLTPRQDKASSPQHVEIIRDIDVPWCPEMVVIQAGTFLMGSPETEDNRFEDEHQHEVTITKPFILGRYPVTFKEYDYFCEHTGRKKPDDSKWGRGDRPVINVSHDDALAYCAWLSETTDRLYHLPSEAQWEYACRSGTTTAYTFGNKITEQQRKVNFGQSRRYGKTSLVGKYSKNAWGFYDMHGNVWEWCADWYGEYGYRAQQDPKGPDRGTHRVARGCSWNCDARNARSACRADVEPDRQNNHIGFRCAGVL